MPLLKPLAAPNKPGVMRPGVWVILLAVLVISQGLLRWELIEKRKTIAPDGVLMIRLAEWFSRDPAGCVKGFPIHPGYPAAVAWTQRHYTSSASLGIAAWEQAAIIVSFVASLAALVGVWCLGRLMLGDWRWAFWAAMLLGAGKKYAALGADALSDSLMLCFAVWAIALGLLTAHRLMNNRKGTFILAIISGLLSAGAYLVRPEGAVTLLAVGLLWLGAAAFKKASWKKTIPAGLAAIAAFGFAALPYMMTVGGFTGKWHSSEFALQISKGPMLACLAIQLYEHTSPSFVKLIGQFFEAAHPAVAGLGCAYLVLAALGRWTKLPRLKESLPKVDRAALWLMGVLMLLCAGPLIMRYRATGAMSYRYLVLPVMVFSPLAMAGLLGLVQWALAGRPKEEVQRWLPRLIAGLSIGIMVALMLHTVKKPMHESRIIYRKAGEELKKQLMQNPAAYPRRVLAEDGLVPHYAEFYRFDQVIPFSPASMKRKDRAKWLVKFFESLQTNDLFVTSGATLNQWPFLKSYLAEQGFEQYLKIKVFHRGKPRDVVVYKKRLIALSQPSSLPAEGIEP